MPMNIGGPELIVLMIIIFVIFGAGKLPEVFGAMGKGVKEFKKAQGDEEMAAEAQQPMASKKEQPEESKA
jgi:sec-independent protein translocase protein TatA